MIKKTEDQSRGELLTKIKTKITHLHCAIVASSYQKMSAALLILDVRNDVRVCWNRVQNLSPSQVPNLQANQKIEIFKFPNQFRLNLKFPHLARVVLAASNHVKAIRGEIDTIN